MAKQVKVGRDHYQEVTDLVIEALKAGTPPWRRPWDTEKSLGPDMPQNAVTGARYRGINILTLGISPLAFSTSDPRWATYKQAQEKGRQVQKGARGVTGFFFKRIELDRSEGGGGGSEEGGAWFPLLRSFTLFHASQIDGMPDYVGPDVETCPWRAPDAVEVIVKNSGVNLRIGGDRAFYSTVTDHVQLPPHGAFDSPAAWSSIEVHEMAHWTGAKHRLNRDMSGRFGSQIYAREELVAELTQMMVCSTLGIVDCDFANGAAYVGDWLRILHDDKKEIFRAAADAQRAADYLLAFHPDFAGRFRKPGQAECPVIGSGVPPVALKKAA